MYIYLQGKVSERGREGGREEETGHLPNGYSGLSWVRLTPGKGPSTRAIIHLISRRITGELKRDWSSQYRSWCPHGIAGAVDDWLPYPVPASKWCLQHHFKLHWHFSSALTRNNWNDLCLLIQVTLLISKICIRERKRRKFYNQWTPTGSPGLEGKIWTREVISGSFGGFFWFGFGCVVVAVLERD